MKLYPVPVDLPGRLSIASCPAVATLDTDIVTLKAAGVTLLVSTLPEKDEVTLGLAAEPSAAKAAGLDFLRIPIADFGVPADGGGVDDDLRSVLARLSAPSEHVAVHCLAGMGRSPMIAAALLVAAGEQPDVAWRMVSTARRRQVPETPEQRGWIQRFARV